MTSIKWKMCVLFSSCTFVIFANAGCNSESANEFKVATTELPSPEIMIEATIEKLENANSLNYERSKNTVTTLNDKMYYSAIITTSRETFPLDTNIGANNKYFRITTIIFNQEQDSNFIRKMMERH